ncbi:hypothetical protein TWF506_000485 [Arthrobotrys conoides]|uniref:Uncharacterized protein n=1 Tax=Arthrobotrys conoides TaxID=74498 RepID=A0AAN8RQK5_9PEZI
MSTHPNPTEPKDPLSRAAWRLRKTAAKSLRTNLGLHIDPRKITYTEKASSLHGYKWVLDTNNLAPESVEYKRMKRMAVSWNVYPNNWNRMDRLKIAQMIDVGWLRPVSLGKSRRVQKMVEYDEWQEEDGELEDDGLLEGQSNYDDNAGFGMEQRCESEEIEAISSSPAPLLGSSRASRRTIGTGDEVLISGTSCQNEPNSDLEENPLIKASRSLDINSKVRSYLALTAELVRDMDALCNQSTSSHEGHEHARREKGIAAESTKDELKVFRADRVELDQKISFLEKRLEHLAREMKEVSPRTQGQNAGFRSSPHMLYRGNNMMGGRPSSDV